MSSEAVIADDHQSLNVVSTIYTIEEAAGILKIKPRTVRAWIDQGKLKSFKIGDLVRVHEDDLQDFINRARESSK